LWCPTPLQKLFFWSHLSDDDYELAGRRAFVLTAVAWLPLLVLSVVGTREYGAVTVPFLRDLDVQARLLVALPLLVAGEVLIHREMPLAVRQLIDRRLVAASARAGFDKAVGTALRLSRSMVVEILILGCVVAIGLEVGPAIASLSDSTWYAQTVNGSTTLTPAGWWNVLISRPLFQFILLRWYFRFLVWNQFLWQVSRLRLHLQPAHPDHRGGLGFLFAVNDAFAPFLFAHGAMLAGRVANAVVHTGASLRQFEVELVVIPAAALLFVVTPELVFTAELWKAKRKGLLDYGILAQRYVREFDHKWLRRPMAEAGALLGSADIQSLADLANSFGTIRDMHVLPDRRRILTLGLFTVLPLAPLPLTVISGRELLERLAKMML